ncbi:protein-glutamate O-methyltransferase [Frigidibacter sp. MR17.14]|uniref:CheR family methyltransferase n=1 Tax=Frigidibacter sp. MR17.14 TaxID=3126509 RepID=UPI003012BAC6
MTAMTGFLHHGGPPAPSPEEMVAIARILHEEAGIVLHPSKSSMVQSRLAKRLRKLSLDGYGDYIALVNTADGQDERRRMISALTTNVSHFFREAHHFDLLRSTVLPPLIERAKAGGRVRLWSAGCSNGQEPWSMTMVIRDLLPEAHRFDLRILATDIDPEVLARAERGVYPAGALEGLDAGLVARHFRRDPDGHGICDEARALLRFRELNLHGPWPMRGTFDVIFCRNVVIYFDAPAQARLWHRFAGALAPGGTLCVGHSERVPVAPTLPFVTAGITSYRRTEAPLPRREDH